MKNNEKIWLIIILFSIILLWLNSRDNNQKTSIFLSAKEEQDWYLMKEQCDKQFNKNKMELFFDCMQSYGKIVKQQWHDGKWINHPVWIWTDKYYEEFDTLGLAKLRKIN